MQTTDTALRDQLRAYIEQNFLYMHPDVELTDDNDLLAQGIIDSLGFVELVEEVQTSYGIQVQDIEITEENFGSINAIVRFVAAKRNSP